MARKAVPKDANSTDQIESKLALVKGIFEDNFRLENPCEIYTETGEFEWCEESVVEQALVSDAVTLCDSTAYAKAKRSALIKAPVPWTREDPPMKLGDGFFGGNGEIHPMDFVHGAAFGATGSGKTINVVKPFVHSAIQYRLVDGTKSAVLVIDPKKELTEDIRKLLKSLGESDRLLVIGECAPIQIFPEDCDLSASDRYDLYRELLPNEITTDNVSWRQKADAMITDLLELELIYYKRCGKRFMACLAHELKVPQTSGASYWSIVRSVLTYSVQGQKRLHTVAATIEKVCASQGVVSPSTLVFGSFTGGSDTVDQACYVLMSAQFMINALCDPSIDELVNLDVIGVSGRTDLLGLIELAKVIVFQPESTTAHNFAARALKQRFFEAIYKRSDMRQPVFFVADEYQTFVSAKDTSLLDRSRGYRTVSLLSSQSLASLRHALGSNIASTNIVEILVTNLPSRYSFRSNCIETAAWLKTQIPDNTQGPHILDVRRLATLKPGEAYYMLADGSWGFDRPSMPLAA